MSVSAIYGSLDLHPERAQKATTLALLFFWGSDQDVLCFLDPTRTEQGGAVQLWILSEVCVSRLPRPTSTVRHSPNKGTLYTVPLRGESCILPPLFVVWICVKFKI